MTLTREMLRSAGKKAYAELKKIGFYESRTEGSLTTLSLFGDAYKFFFDTSRKMAWMESKHHYKESFNFTLGTKHKTWVGMFSYPREVAYNILLKEFENSISTTSRRSPEDYRTLRREASIVLSQAYRAKKDKLARIFGGVLWKHLDKEIASLALRSFGFSSGSLDYTVVANNKEEIIDTLNKAPGILPIWRNLVLLKMLLKKNEISSKLFVTGQHHHFNYGDDDWVSLTHPAISLVKFNYPELINNFVFPDIIKTVKSILEPLGLTSAGWRHLIKMKPRAVALFLQNEELRSFVKTINWLAAIEVMPRHSIIKPLLNSRQFCLSRNRTESLLALFRAAFTYASKMRSGVRNFYSEQLGLVLDWFVGSGERHSLKVDEKFRCGDDIPLRDSNQVILDANQRKAGWDWFMRQQEAWHREQDLREIEEWKSRVKNQSWESAISELTINNFKVVPLTNSYALLEEGKDMHHCVGSYSQSCIDGESRIFSIRDLKDKKIATLELRYRDKWYVGQCRSACNKDVSPAIKSVAESVARKYNKIYEKGAIAI